MKRVFGAALFVVTSFVSQMSAASNTDFRIPDKGSQKLQGDLRSWSIVPEEIGRTEGSDRSIDCGVHDHLMLTRPGESNVVAIVDDDVILNPKGFNYGPIPSLNEITIQQADALWGSVSDLSPNDSGTRSYKLIALGNRKPEQFSLWILSLKRNDCKSIASAILDMARG